MCIGCDWGKYNHLFKTSDAAPADNGPSRRRLLQAGALVAAAVAAPIPALARPKRSSGNKADIVFRNGPVYTINPDKPWARAVAVKGKQIVFVGDEAGVKPLIGPRTRVVDLAGKMLLPGFVEGHIHPLAGAALTQGVDLQFDTRNETLAALRAYRDKIGKVDIVRGFGWRYSGFPATGPRKEDLDALWPDVPVILIAIDCHSAWVNSQALALAGVTKDTKDPLPGFSYFARDPATGEATGYLVEPPALQQVNNAIDPFTRDYVAQALEQWLPRASAGGITTVFDAGIQVVPDMEGFAIYSKLEREGKLPFRVIGAHYHNRPDVDPLPVIKALRREFQSELVQASVLKLNIDGGDAQRTAALLAPYADDPQASGQTLLRPEVFSDIIRRADRDGLDIHIHSFADRATRLSLDAFEAAIKANPPRDRRHGLAHNMLVAPEDAPRFGKLGVIAQFSAQWTVPDRYWQDISRARLGAERSDRLYCMKSILDHGGVLSFGTDWPAAGHYSTFHPLEAIEIATTRRELDKPHGPQLAPAPEAVTLDAALRANTMGAAYQLRMEHKVGSIETGKLADLVVLDRNLFETPSHEIHKAKVLMTVMNGQVRHEQRA
jgi:predicted amidohydrolase YtcJ